MAAPNFTHIQSSQQKKNNALSLGTWQVDGTLQAVDRALRTDPPNKDSANAYPYLFLQQFIIGLRNTVSRMPLTEQLVKTQRPAALRELRLFTGLLLLPQQADCPGSLPRSPHRW